MIRAVLRLLVVVWVGLLCGAPAQAEDTALSASKDSTFRRGNEAYFRGRYREAVEAYERVAALGVVSADLYYNLGNGYLREGRLGPAIYNYERALALDPAQDDVRFNLKAARDLVSQRGADRLVGVDTPPWWIRAVQPYTVGGLGWGFFAIWVTLFASLIGLRFVPPGFLRAGLWAGFGFLMLATVTAGAMLGGRLYLAERVEQAIVLPDAVQVKEGPDLQYQTVFAVHAGLRVRVTEKDQDWLRVRLSNGLEGWLREAEVGRL